MRPNFGRRGNASVEFALMMTFFLLPLLLGSSDFIIYLLARAQLNTALQALYYFAITDPADAAVTTNVNAVLSAINANSIYHATLTSATAEYACITSSSGITYQTTACTSGTQVNAVAYALSTTFAVPLNLHFGITNPVTLSVSGATLD